MNVILYFIFFAIIIILIISAAVLETPIPIFGAFILLLIIGITLASTGIERANYHVNKTTVGGIDILKETTVYTEEKTDLTTWSGILISFLAVILFLIATVYIRSEYWWTKNL